MDKLEVLKSAEQKGGKERREKIEKLMIYARNLNCVVTSGGGAVGGINFRYGSIGYAIMDINTDGDVKLYAQPHPNKGETSEICNLINDFLKEHEEQLKMKSATIKCHGQLSEKIENISLPALMQFLEVAKQGIVETYYKV